MAKLFFRPLVLTLLVSTAAAAQEHEGGGSVNLLAPNAGLMFWTLVIFVLLFVLLSRLAFPKLIGAVEARERALQQMIDDAKRDREEAARLVAEHRRQIEEARGEAQRIITEGRATAEHMRNELLDQTRAQQQELLERARREIEGEKVKAIADLRREAVDLAIAGAGKVIERNLDNATNRQLVESFLGSLTPTTVRR